QVHACPVQVAQPGEAVAGEADDGHLAGKVSAAVVCGEPGPGTYPSRAGFIGHVQVYALGHGEAGGVPAGGAKLRADGPQRLGELLRRGCSGGDPAIAPLDGAEESLSAAGAEPQWGMGPLQRPHPGWYVIELPPVVVKGHPFLGPQRAQQIQAVQVAPQPALGGQAVNWVQAGAAAEPDAHVEPAGAEPVDRGQLPGELIWDPERSKE